MGALSYIEKIFPPPRFITLPSVGVDVSDSSLKYIQFEPNDNGLALRTWGDIAIADGVVQRGTVLNSAQLVDALRRVRAACGTSYVRLSLPEERAYLFETTIERGTPYADIRGLLEFRMEENVPLSPRDAYFDYDLIEDDVDEHVLRVSVTAYARETIQDYHDACRAAGLLSLSFEVESAAIARAVIPRTDCETYMLIDFGKTRTGIGIVHRRTLVYTSTIELGGAQLSHALQVQCGEHDEAEYTRLKNEYGLLHTGEDDDVYEALLPTMAALRDEIATRISYWNNRDAGDGPRGLQKILLVGGGANLAGLPEYFTEELKIETERADVWQGAFTPSVEVPPITKRHSYGYATAIGLALRTSLTHSS